MNKELERLLNYQQQYFRYSYPEYKTKPHSHENRLKEHFQAIARIIKRPVPNMKATHEIMRQTPFAKALFVTDRDKLHFTPFPSAPDDAVGGPKAADAVVVIKLLSAYHQKNQPTSHTKSTLNTSHS